VWTGRLLSNLVRMSIDLFGPFLKVVQDFTSENSPDVKLLTHLSTSAVNSYDGIIYADSGSALSLESADGIGDSKNFLICKYYPSFFS
jgi:hypothetical protein